MQIARPRILKKTAFSLTSSIYYVIEECWKITGIYLKFVYLVKVLSNRQATLSPENLEITKQLCGVGLDPSSL